ncbi:MAG: ExeM/NucH family extracellular endonuclease [Nocardioides sp.]|nr:ExeM/NucH family extracellular endonuclease [Nocardioides sp.]
MSSSRARALVSSTVLALLAPLLALGFVSPAQAAVSHLVISEAYGGGGNSGAPIKHDFVELYNPTDADVVMTDWSLQYRSAGGTTAPSGTNITVLNGTVPAKGFFLVRQAAGAGTQPEITNQDATGATAMGGSGFQVWLANTTTPQNPTNNDLSANTAIVDFVGAGSAAVSEGATPAPAPSNSTSVFRKDAGGSADPRVDSDVNGNDFGTAAPTPQNSAERFPPVVGPTPLAATGPGDKTVVVDQAIPNFALQASGGTAPYTWSATGAPSMPAGLTVGTDGVVSGTPTETGTFTITATVTDSATPAATASTEFTITVVEPAVLRTIAEIQGTTDVSPYAGTTPGQPGAEAVRTQGVITASYPSGSGNLAGFFMQTGGAPDTPGASDGIFVFMGAAADTATYAIGDSVEVTGKVSEYFNQTQISPGADGSVIEIAALPAPVLATTVPGSDCAVGSCPDAAALNEQREAHEGEAFDLSATDVTVSDSYSGGVGSSQMRGEFGLALNSTEPLVQPLEVVRPSNTAGLADHNAYNKARGIVLDDGSTFTYNASTAYPWLTLANTVRAGAAATFVKPVVLSWSFNAWRLQPETRIPAGNDGSAWVAFEQDRPAAPEDVLKGTGNLKIATFNMLNYFVHPAEEWDLQPDDAIGQDRYCTYYNDRQGNKITARECTWKDLRLDPPSTLPDIGPRGAATAVSLARQEVKEVAAINEMDADIVSLEEVENPVKIGYADRDLPLEQLVDALNAAWDQADITANGPRWAYVPSPRVEAQPSIAEQDAIRNAFIYNPRKVARVGRSRIALTDPAFRNAREPLAQAFRHVDGLGPADSFFVVTNHFKSKGAPQDPSLMPADSDNQDTGNGAGWYNGDRVRQARALDTFAKSLTDDTGIDAVFLAGDFTAYGQEDPVVTLNDRGWELLEAENGETSYFFGGLAGSLDHVFANAAAKEMVTGTTVWPINANEPVYYEYSRFNYNVTPLYDETAFRSSDHNPEVVGLTAPVNAAADPVDTVQVLASNDFHGRLLDDPAGAGAGAAAMAGAVKELRAANPDTVFSMAGDIVGATTFESMAQNDKPTIDAMNEAGLEVSAAGNHEFDQGYDDLLNRIMSASAADGGADWPYIAANVRLGDASGPYALESDRTDGNFANSNGATWWKEFPGLDGGEGINVGFVGAVTEDLPRLVSPESVAGLAITSVVDEVNAAAADLKDDGCGGEPCDLVVELVHEGAASATCSTIATDTESTFGRIVHGASADVDAIISGHTHQKYNCKVPVADWSSRTVKERPVVSAGQYGAYLNQLQFDFAPGTDDLVAIRQRVLAMKDHDEDPATKAIVQDAVDFAAVEGAEPLGLVEDQFLRAQRKDEQGLTVENRGGESTLGNLVAEIQRWKTGADLAVMNPGGLRQDLDIDDNGTVTKREAVEVQPFANTLMTTELTGAQLKTLLEQQWQRDPDGNTPSRPFLRLGTSYGFTFTEDASRPEGDRITGMWLDGVQVVAAGTYTVAANSFVMAGGDNFHVFKEGANTRDTGFTDLQATTDYLATMAPVGGTPLALDRGQHAVGAKLLGAPVLPGDQVTIPVDSLSMTGATDVQDTSVEVSLGDQVLGTFPVTTTLPTTPYDVAGTATLEFTMPEGVLNGTTWLTLEGLQTGTVARIPVPTEDPRATTTVTATAADIVADQAGTVLVTVDPAAATGKVTVSEGANVLGEAMLDQGQAQVSIPAGALAVGEHTLLVSYEGDAAHEPDTYELVVTVVEPTPEVVATTTTATAQKQEFGKAGQVAVTVAPSEATGDVQLLQGDTIIATGSLTGGAATLTVPAKRFAVGRHVLVVKYLGSETHAASQTSVALIVVKQKPKLVVPKPRAVRAGRVAKVVAKVSAVGYVPSGKVRFVFRKAGTSKRVRVVVQLRRGTNLAQAAAKVRLRARGRYTVRVRYLGDASTQRALVQTRLRIR